MQVSVESISKLERRMQVQVPAERVSKEIAARLKNPQRFAGMHFFNPVPLMKVVEIISGLKTDTKVCTTLAAYTRQMGHTPVQAAE